MNDTKYQLIIIDEVEGKNIAKYLGGCKSRKAADELFRTAYAEQKLIKPKVFLLVPSDNVVSCKAVQVFQLEALVEGALEEMNAGNTHKQ
jgi:hypothetical protein